MTTKVHFGIYACSTNPMNSYPSQSEYRFHFCSRWLFDSPPHFSRTLWLTLLVTAGCLVSQGGRAASFMEGLAQPHEGRSMRTTSTMRVGEVRRGNAERKLNPKADPRGDLEEASNYDNFTVPPGETHVLMDEKGPGRYHSYLDHVPWPGAAGLGQEGRCEPPGNVAANILGRV